MLTFIQTLPKTFYSSSFYRDLVKKGKGWGLGFLLFATLLSLAQTVRSFDEIFSSLWAKENAVFESLPEVTIQDGKLSLDVISPVIVPLSQESGEAPLKIVFDTRLPTSDLDALVKKMHEEDIFILVTEDNVIFYNKANRTQNIQPIKELKDTKLTRETWLETRSILQSVFLPLFMIFSASIYFLGYLLSAGIVALVIRGLSPLLKLKLPFEAAMRLVLAARIPSAAILLLAAPAPLVQLLIWTGFVLFGLLSVRKET